MAIYRKKPGTVEAFRWQGELEPSAAWPEWAVSALDNETLRLDTQLAERPFMVVKVYEGGRIDERFLAAGGYLICGENGCIYPCREDVFEVTYEPNNEQCPKCGESEEIREGYHQDKIILTCNVCENQWSEK